MTINYLIIFVVILVSYVVVNMIIKTLDEKSILEDTIKQSIENPDEKKKYIDIYLQKKSKILLIRSGIAAVLITGFLKFYIDRCDPGAGGASSIFHIEAPKSQFYGGCGCDNKTSLPF
jgi:hypothetical protein